MLSKKNKKEMRKRSRQCNKQYGLRKTSIGLISCAIGLALFAVSEQVVGAEEIGPSSQVKDSAVINEDPSASTLEADQDKEITENTFLADDTALVQSDSVSDLNTTAEEAVRGDVADKALELKSEDVGHNTESEVSTLAEVASDPTLAGKDSSAEDKIPDVYDDIQRPPLSALHEPEGEPQSIREIIPVDGRVVIENDYLSRSMTVEDGQLRTESIHNKLSDDTLIFAEESDEFKIQFKDSADNHLAVTLQDLHLKEKGGIIEYEYADLIRTEFNFKPISLASNQNEAAEILLAYIIDLEKEGKYLRNHLRIHLSDSLKDKLSIDTIDLQRFKLQGNETVHTFDEQEPIYEMAGFGGFYAGLGQPVYIDSFYTGAEFPVALNTVSADDILFSRYYSGKTFGAMDLDKDDYYQTWSTIIGVARSDDYQIVQLDFFDYIDDIAKPSYYRKQYNTWYDFMQGISAENIATSFEAIDRGFNLGGISPLDSFVVDDGYQDMTTLWVFNEKFPNKLYDSSRQVKRFGSNFGLWLGPQGGYSQPGVMADALEEQGLGSKHAGVVYIGDKRYTVALANDVFKPYQADFDINYWKLDGLLLNPRPDTDPDGHFIGGGYQNMYSMTETHERWINLFNIIFEYATDPDTMWINLTSYVPPSPWYLQWVNSIWMQNTADSGFENHVTNTDLDFGNDMNQAVTYRDKSYQRLVEDRRWQIPFKYLYNHDPVYGHYQTSAKLREPEPRKPIDFSTDDLREYLYMIATRGNRFWEFYYSHEKFSDDDWLVNGEAVNWMENNHHILENAVYHGGKPDLGEAYGFSAWTESEGIVSFRNPIGEEQVYTLTLNNLVGVPEGIKDLHRITVMGDERHRTAELTHYGDSVTIHLQPYEAVVFQYSLNEDEQAATIESSWIDDDTHVKMRFNETINIDEASFNVADNDVVKVELGADLRTVTLILAEPLADRSSVIAEYSQIKDLAGDPNYSAGQLTLTNYSNRRMLDIVEPLLGVPLYEEGISGSGEFSVTIQARLDELGQTLAEQKGEWSLAVDHDGRVVFSIGQSQVSSAPFVELSADDLATPDYLIKAGDTFIVTAIRNRNGSLRLYINGELHHTTYDPLANNQSLTGNDIVIGDANFKGEIERFILENKAHDYQTVKEISQEIDPQPYYQSVEVVNAQAPSFDPDDAGPKPPEYGYDGNPNTYWVSDKAKDNRKETQYYMIELAEPKTISRIHYTPRHIPNAVGNLKSGAFEYSLDGKEWHRIAYQDTDIISFNPAGGRQNFEIEPTEMKYLRLIPYETAHWLPDLEDSVFAVAELGAETYHEPSKVLPSVDPYLRNLADIANQLAQSLQEKQPELAREAQDIADQLASDLELRDDRHARYLIAKERIALIIQRAKPEEEPSGDEEPQIDETTTGDELDGTSDLSIKDQALGANDQTRFTEKITEKVTGKVADKDDEEIVVASAVDPAKDQPNKLDSKKLPQTGFISNFALGIGIILSAVGSAITFRRRK